MFNYFKFPRGKSKVIGHKYLPTGTRVIEYSGEFADVQEEIQGLVLDLIVTDEWEAYNFTEEVFNEVKKIQEQRLRAEELLKDINFKLVPMEWETEYYADECFDDVLIKYGIPY